LEVRLPVDMTILTSGFDEALFKRPHADTPVRFPLAAHFDRNETYAYFGDRTLAPVLALRALYRPFDRYDHPFMQSLCRILYHAICRA
jgi:hypothetical protein